MKILFVAWNFPPRVGGAEHLAHRLAEHLAESHEVCVVTAAGALGGGGRLRLRRSLLPGFAGFLVWLPWALGRELLRRRPEVVLVLGAPLAVVVRPVTALWGVPQAALVFGSDLVHGGRLVHRVLGWMLPLSERVLAISREVAVLARTRGGVAAGRIALLPPGVDVDLPNRPWDDSLAAPGAAVILFVGRVVARKGLRPFVHHCLPRILSEVDAELWVIGGEPVASLAHAPGELARLREELASSPLEARVRLFGHVPEATLLAAYRRAHLLVLPAVPEPGDVEGFGIVFLEAALFGLPAAAVRLGGIPDAVVDGETGLLAPPGDWDRLSEHVVRLLRDDELRRRLGEQARSRALADFPWATIARRCAEQLAGISR